MKCEKQRQKHLEFVVPTEVYLASMGRLSLLANPIKRSHMWQDRDFAEGTLSALYAQSNDQENGWQQLLES
jgi:hypothetical protein